MISFAKVLKDTEWLREGRNKKPKPRKKKSSKKPHIQEQKYSLVPKWRRRRGGKMGQKI